jgi:anti-sigma-K factor RskA
MNEEDWVELLRETHREPIDPAHYVAVRARVLAELGRGRRPVWPWAWALAAAAVAVVLAFVMIPRPKPVGQEPVVIKLLTDDPNVVIYWIGE